jgi:head-tail adaptor
VKTPALSRFQHRLVIREPVEDVQDDMGGFVPAVPAILGTVWAALDPLAARDRERAHQRGVAVTHRVWMRVVPGVTLRDGLLLVAGARTLVVRSWIDVEERGRFWAIDAEEVR